jgi:hypothetical protein
MRIGALLLVGLGILTVAACTASTSSDQVCVGAGGVCLPLSDSGGPPAGCLDQENGLTCDTGYVCCTGQAVAPAPTATTPAVSADASKGD